MSHSDEGYLPHLLRDGAFHTHQRYGADTCSGPPPSLVDQWLLPVTLVSSLVCCVVLVVDVILRLRPQKSAHARRRTASAMSDYSIDDFECLDMGTANMLFHLQTECNDISAKIDRCAMSLVSSFRGMSEAVGTNPSDSSGLEELALSRDELSEQWENLRWFQQFVGIHMRNAFSYQQFHSQLEELGSALEEAFRQLHLLLLQTRTDSPTEAMEDLASCIHFLVGISSALVRVLEESTQIVPLHRRVKFTGRQEALPVRALCDYQKDGFITRLGEPLKLVWRKNKYTWRVRNPQGVEGDLPAICCLLPGPDPDTMMQARSLADYFTSQWHAYSTQFEENMCHYICHALFKAGLQDSLLVVPTDTNRLQARQTLSLVEGVMTSEASHHVISEQDRKSSQGVLHQLYELLNGATAREETSAFLVELEKCYILTQKFQKLSDLVAVVATKSQTIGKRITEVKGRKRPALLVRQTSASDDANSKFEEATPPQSEQGNHKFTREPSNMQEGKDPTATSRTPKAPGRGSTGPNDNKSVTGHDSSGQEKSSNAKNPVFNYPDPQITRMETTQKNTSNSQARRLSPQTPPFDNGYYSQFNPDRSWSDEDNSREGDWFSAPNTPSPRPKVKALGEPQPPRHEQRAENPEMTKEWNSQNNPAKSSNGQSPSFGGLVDDGNRDCAQQGTNRRSTVRDSSGTTGPGRPRTLGITPRHASLTSNATFGDPSVTSFPLNESVSVKFHQHPTCTGTSGPGKHGHGTLLRSVSSDGLSRVGPKSPTPQTFQSKTGFRVEKKMHPTKEENIKQTYETGSSDSIVLTKTNGDIQFEKGHLPRGTRSFAQSKESISANIQETKPFEVEYSNTTLAINEQSRHLNRQGSKSSSVSSTSSTPQSPTPSVYFSCPSSPQVENNPFIHHGSARTVEDRN